MAKAWKLILLCLVLAALCGAAQAQVWPTVSFSFNPATFEYAYTVNYPADATYGFLKFQVFSSLPANAWTSYSGPWSPADESWSFQPAPNGDGTYGFYWQAKTGQERGPGTAWTGTFKIIVPNTQPIVGSVQTAASTIRKNTVSSYVPGAVPEPTSLAAMGTLLAGLVPLALRRRSK